MTAADDRDLYSVLLAEAAAAYQHLTAAQWARAARDAVTVLQTARNPTLFDGDR
jgi:hypothetical protein